METMDTMNALGEPRAWVLQWEGTALFAEPQGPRQCPGRLLEQNPRWRRVALPEADTHTSRNGHQADVWREPSAWSLAWDGAVALDGARPASDATAVSEAMVIVAGAPAGANQVTVP